MKSPFPLGSLLVLTFLLVATLAPEARAHVPYLETRDFTLAHPFTMTDVEQSLAIYSWLEPRARQDIDLYRMEVKEPVRIHGEVLVPVCPGYDDFSPWFALIGPNLPAPTAPLPINLPEGYGAVIMEGPPGSDREIFYEPFGGKHYYQGPVLDREVDTPGVYFMIYWHPQRMTGDYVAVLGYEERFPLQDIIRALIITPLIRHDLELHVDCPSPR